MYADRSASGRVRALKAATLATYHTNNPTKNDFGGLKSSDALTVLLRGVGTVAQCGQCCEPVCNFSLPALVGPVDVTLLSDFEGYFNSIIIGAPYVTIPTPPNGYPDSRPALFIGFPAMCNATSYTVTLTDTSGNVPTVQHFLGVFNTEPGSSPYDTNLLGFIMVYPLQDNDIYSYTGGVVTAANECSQTTTEIVYGCFLEGAQVAMADGTFKAIEAVAVGDSVRGAFGESNTVTALHRPQLGAGGIVNVNGEHKTTTHHPHVGAGRQFYCVEPSIIKGFTYGKEHTVIVNNSGKKEKRLMKGLKPERIAKLEVGVELQTLGGAKRVDTLEKIPMSPFTQVYHLAVSGSHTFVVDGYAVTGWPNEDDFDYDAWTSKM